MRRFRGDRNGELELLTEGYAAGGLAGPVAVPAGSGGSATLNLTIAGQLF